MPPNSSAPRSANHGPAQRRVRPLRTIEGGYDPAEWPIHVPKLTDESLHSWLRRLAHRYGLAVSQVLAALDVTLPSRGVPDLRALVLENREKFAKVRLDTDAVVPGDMAGTLVEMDDHYWKHVRQQDGHQRRGSSQFCADCLAETDGIWLETWSHTYHFVCAQHGKLLQSTCPSCGAAPFRTPVWLAYKGAAWNCAAFTGKGNSRYRARCEFDLRQSQPDSAPAWAVQAQRWLFSLVEARYGGSHVIALGMRVPAQVAYQAAAEIITENTDYTDGKLDVANACKTAQDILTADSLDHASAASDGVAGFDPEHGVAPIGPYSSASRRPRNSLVTAISLHRLRGKLSTSAELKFRIGTSVPSYPTSWTIESIPLTPANALPELPFAWIPSTLWPNLVTLGDAELDRHFAVSSPLGRAFAAIALARFGSARDWRLIATNLMLPGYFASLGAKHWRHISSEGLWPRYVESVAEAFERLHSSPPPIDYRRRRLSATPVNVDAAMARVADTLPESARESRDEFASSVWARFTGAHRYLAPAAPRLHRGDPDMELFPESVLEDVALQLVSEPDEPLVWLPP